MSDYRYLLTSLYQSGSTANPVIAELPFTNVNFTQQLNSIGTFTGELLLGGIDVTKLNVLDSTVPGQTCLYVQYGNNIVWGGIIWQRDWDSTTQKLTVTAQELLSYFDKRRVTSNITYTSQDPCYIANDLLVTYSQAKSHGNIGVASSATTSGYSVTRSFFNFELKSVYQAVKDLSNGFDATTTTPFFDFTIRPAFSGSGSSQTIVKNFIMGAPYIGTYASPSSVFQFPGNIVEYNYPEDASRMANVLYGLGYGANTTRLMSTAKDNGTGGTLASGGTAALLEESLNLIDISDQSLLSAMSLGHLNAVSQPPVTIQIVLPSFNDPVFGTYKIGDFSRLVLMDERFPSGLDSIYRIVAINATPGEDGPDRITVTLTKSLYGTGTVATGIS